MFNNYSSTEESVEEAYSENARNECAVQLATDFCEIGANCCGGRLLEMVPVSVWK